MSTNNNYPSHVPQWKKDVVNWLYEKDLLKDEEWKQKVEEPLPLWAEALILRRIFEKVSKKD